MVFQEYYQITSVYRVTQCADDMKYVKRKKKNLKQNKKAREFHVLMLLENSAT